MKQNLFLVVLGLIVAGSVMTRATVGVKAQAPRCAPENPACEARFQKELPRPKVLAPSNPNGPIKEYTVTMEQASVDLGFRRPGDATPVKTPIWGYNGQFPGPTIEAQTNKPIRVRWYNCLTEAYKDRPSSQQGMPCTAGSTPLPYPFADLGGDAGGVNTDIHGAADGPQARAVVHMHGGHSPVKSDGYSSCAYDPVQGVKNPVAKADDPCYADGPNLRTFTYPNRRQGTTLWYHDHAMGTTRLSVYAGLAGFYFTRDSYEAKLNLPVNNDKQPSKDHEIPLVIQDRTFDEDPTSPSYGRLKYGTDETAGEFSASPVNPPVDAADPRPYPPESYGKTILVNGAIWPKMTVSASRYRFRILNGSNARVYNLKLRAETGTTQPPPAMVVIGADGGLIPDAAQIMKSGGTGAKLNSFLLAPGERIDIVIDFVARGGAKYVLINDAPAPFKGRLLPDVGVDGVPINQAPDPNSTGKVMRFEVQPNTAALINTKDLSTFPDPAQLRPLEDFKTFSDRIGKLPNIKQRWVTLHENGMLMLGNDGKPHMFDDPITEGIKLNTNEVWHIVNLTVDTHPIHLHFVPFRVIGRSAFKVTSLINDGKASVPDPNDPNTLEYNAVFTSYPMHTKLQPYLEPPNSPAVYERGLKDVVQANPKEVTTIAVNFCGGYKADGFNCGPYNAKEDSGFIGKFVWHCHILEHEDNEMMRPLEIKQP
jgi:spore coat protein A, manganese oxidase